MGAFSVPVTLSIDNHSLDAVLFLLSADHHGFFAEHHILNALFIVADTLVAIEPFHFPVLLVVCVNIEEANRETDCCENEESDNKVHLSGNYQPPMAVGHMARFPFQTVGSVVESSGAVRVDVDNTLLNHLLNIFAELFLDVFGKILVEKIGYTLAGGFDYVSWRLFVESSLDFFKFGKNAILDFLS